MKVTESCAKCLYDKQAHKNPDEAYLKRVRQILDRRSDTDCSPYMVYLFNRLHEEMFGKGADYTDIKKKYNDLVLGMEQSIRDKIDNAEDPLLEALTISMVGNYIDLGAMNHVSEDTFLKLFEKAKLRDEDYITYEAFLDACRNGRNMLLLCDNCGEVVLDKLLLEQIGKRFPGLNIRAMVRGGQVLNDATIEDAVYVGLDKVCELTDNGSAIAGTIYDMLSDEAKKIADSSDVILSKGQGNYESFSGHGFDAFYIFLCKCDLFTGRFNVPPLTGVFVEEKSNISK